MKPRILLVEDEPGLVLTVGDRLRAEGFALESAGTVRDARRLLAAGGFDLIILDLMLPDGSGLELCRRLRAHDPTTPVLMLSALSSIEQRVAGLGHGADDYLAKPFDSRELVARTQALLRRAGALQLERGSCLRFGAIEIDRDAAECRVDGRPVEMSARLFRLLCYFAANPDRMLSRDRLLNEVWGYDALPATRTVDVHVGWLRRRIEPDPRRPVHLLTVHGMGYKFVSRPEAARQPDAQVAEG